MFCHSRWHDEWVWLICKYFNPVSCDSLWTTSHPEKKWTRRSTTFTSRTHLFCLCLHFCVICPPASLVLRGVHVCAFVGMNCVWLVCLVCLFWFIFSRMVFFVRGNSRFFLFPSSSGICTILVITSFSASLDTFIVLIKDWEIKYPYLTL